MGGFQTQLPENIHSVFRNGHAGGQARGVNGSHVDEIAHTGTGTDDEIAICLGSPDTGEGSDDLTESDTGNTLGGQPDDHVDTGGGDLLILRGFHPGRGGAGQQIAVNRGGDQDTLAFLGRNLENGMGSTEAFRLVQQQVLTGSGDDGKGFVTGHGGDLVGISTGAVDQIFGLDALPVRGGNGKNAVLLCNAGNRKIHLQIHAVVHGVTHGSDGQLVGADDTGSGNIQHQRHGRGQVGFLFPGFITGEQGHTGNAVFNTPVVKRPDGGLFLRAKGADKGAVAHAGNMQLLRSGVELFDTLDVHLRLHGTGLWVETAVNDTAVGLGSTAGNVILLFQQTHIQLIPGQFSCQHTADDACANNDYIINHVDPLLFL